MGGVYVWVYVLVYTDTLIDYLHAAHAQRQKLYVCTHTHTHTYTHIHAYTHSLSRTHTHIHTHTHTHTHPHTHTHTNTHTVHAQLRKLKTVLPQPPSQVEIRKSQLATQFMASNNYRTDFLRISLSHLWEPPTCSCWPQRREGGTRCYWYCKWGECYRR